MESSVRDVQDRKGLPLLQEEREIIAREVWAKRSYRFIGHVLGSPHQTIAREVNRHGGREGYSPARAEREYQENLKRPKPRKIEENELLHDKVAAGLREKCSPQEISADFGPSIQMTRECEPRDHLPNAVPASERRATNPAQPGPAIRPSATREPLTRRADQAARGAHPQNMVNISERPAEADDRAVPGFWEGDLILGTQNRSQFATLVERQTRFVMLVRIPYDRTADRVATLLAKKVKTLLDFMRKSITWDQGKQMAAHARLAVADLDIYFCDPHSPWQRGTNENTSTDLSNHTQADLDAVAAELNGRPRKTLGWLKPIEVHTNLLAAHGVTPTP